MPVHPWGLGNESIVTVVSSFLPSLATAVATIQDRTAVFRTGPHRCLQELSFVSGSRKERGREDVLCGASLKRNVGLEEAAASDTKGGHNNDDTRRGRMPGNCCVRRQNLVRIYQYFHVPAFHMNK